MAPSVLEKKPTVFVVDDDSGVCQLVTALAQSLGYETRAYAKVETFLRDLAEAPCDCLVLDLQLKGINGLEILERLTSSPPRLPTIVVSGHANVASVRRAFRAGIVDFLLKPFDPGELTNLIRQSVEDHQRALSDYNKNSEFERRLDLLTPRERQVADLVVSGLPSKLMAAQLGISTKTVEVHRMNVMTKAQATNVADLVRMILVSRKSRGLRLEDHSSPRHTPLVHSQPPDTLLKT